MLPMPSPWTEGFFFIKIWMLRVKCVTEAMAFGLFPFYCSEAPFYSDVSLCHAVLT